MSGYSGYIMLSHFMSGILLLYLVRSC